MQYKPPMLPGFSRDKVQAWLSSQGLSITQANSPGQPRPPYHQPPFPEFTHRRTAKTPDVPSINPILTQPAAGSTNPGAAKKKSVDFVELTRDESVAAGEVEVPNGGVEFSECGINTKGLVQLSKYFQTRLKEFDTYIPLTVFNPAWLRQDLLQQSLRRRSTKEKLDDTYIGLTVPLEWKMTFGEWVVAFDLFCEYLDYYKFEAVATKFRMHKVNVLTIKRENSNWPVAFRYDLAVRTTVMSLRNDDGKVANPSIRNELLEQQAIRDTTRFNDFGPENAEINPYVDGGPKANINPLTGEDRRYNSTNNSQFANHHQGTSNAYGKPNARLYAFANQLVYEGPGGSASNTWEDRGSGDRNTRFRQGRGGSNGNHGRSPPRRRSDQPEDTERTDSRRNVYSDSWKRDDRNDDRRGEGQGGYGGRGRAK